MTRNAVFISYSHDTPEHTRQVLQLANALRGQGVDVELDQYHVRPPLGWPSWCEEQLRPENAAFVLVICTNTYRQRVEGKTAADEGRGVFWEGRIIYSYIYNEKGNQRFIPVLLPGAKEDDVPRPLHDDARYHLMTIDLSDPGYLALYRELTGQPAVIKPPKGLIVSLPPDAQGAVIPLGPLPARQVLSRFIPVDISRIIKYAPAELIGREAETKGLTDAWDKARRAESPRPHVLTIVALGGEGKTSLVAKWVAELAGKDWPECETAFAWSFYSQGTRDQPVASSDTFLKDALTFFGDATMAGSAQSGFDKGRRLAQLVGGRRALLILDGLEPLQYAPTSPTPGELKDQGLAALLRGLAATSHGLCVVTTRYSIPDLRAYWQTTAPEVALLRLSREAGVALLKKLGVNGNQEEFETLVEDVKGHALTLNLLGTYLRDAHGGDIRKSDVVRLEEADSEEHAGHAFRVMDEYVKSLESGGRTADENERGQRALALLRLLGLFDRPATAHCLEALWKGDAIPGLTHPLVGLSEAQRNVALSRLEEAGLLTVNRDASRRLVTLDAHPLIREYFARRLRQLPEAWRAAHRRLYEHLCGSTKDRPQPTLEDLQPLYQAVAHGCQAGLQQEACDGIYYGRIQRGKEGYSTVKLGALGSDLGAIACFFEEPWRRLSSSLTDADQGWLLNEAAFHLRALGRLTEALEPFRAALEMATELQVWENAANGAGSLSELELTLGEVAEAVAHAEQSVTYADRTGDAKRRMALRTVLADALHKAGRRADADVRLREIEALQTEAQPDSPHPRSGPGFRCCDLLLTEAERGGWQTMLECAPPQAREARKVRKALQFSGRPDSECIAAAEDTLAQLRAVCHAVSQRAAHTLSSAEEENRLLDIALDHLTLGRAALYEGILEGEAACSPPDDPQRNGDAAPHLDTAHRELEAAVDGLRRAVAQHYLPRGLLARAWLRFRQDDAEGARADLDEAWEIAERGPMPLFLADIHLYRARLFGTTEQAGRVGKYPWGSPQADLAAAEVLIEHHAYHLRTEELVDAKRFILSQV